MQLRLKVIGGKNDGREIEIKGAEFTIGRGDDVNLRPQSDLISRRHCSLGIRDGKAYLKDLNSSNGTYLNGNRIQGEVQLNVRDRLRVGRLQFEVVIDHSKPSAKRPKVAGVKEVAARTVSSAPEADMEENITDWLTEGDETTTPPVETGETRQFRLDDSDRTYVPETPVPKSLDETVDKSDEDSEDASAQSSKKAKKKKPGKLPDLPTNTSENSKDAASEMLRKFFNRR
jgi:pSer/pThr/pTyr-binding forkhead associated (FHA) protein